MSARQEARLRAAAFALTAMLTAATTSAAPDDPIEVLGLREICRPDGQCHVSVDVRSNGVTTRVVTTFRANRVGPDMKYRKGDEYGGATMPTAGLFYRESQVVMEEDGTVRAPEAGDPPGNRLDMVTNVAIDPNGHVTFYYGYVRAPDFPAERGFPCAMWQSAISSRPLRHHDAGHRVLPARLDNVIRARFRGRTDAAPRRDPPLACATLTPCPRNPPNPPAPAERSPASTAASRPTIRSS